LPNIPFFCKFCCSCCRPKTNVAYTMTGWGFIGIECVNLYMKCRKELFNPPFIFSISFSYAAKKEKCGNFSRKGPLERNNARCWSSQTNRSGWKNVLQMSNLLCFLEPGLLRLPSLAIGVGGVDGENYNIIFHKSAFKRVGPWVWKSPDDLLAFCLAKYEKKFPIFLSTNWTFCLSWLGHFIFIDFIFCYTKLSAQFQWQNKFVEIVSMLKLINWKTRFLYSSMTSSSALIHYSRR
jgi:hypothetical protein